MANVNDSTVFPLGGESTAPDRQLFLDTCDSPTLPSGVITASTPQYNSSLKTRYFNNDDNVAYNYQLPITGTLSDDLMLFNAFIAPVTFLSSSPIIDIYLNGIARYSLAFQNDGNIVFYRSNSTAPWVSGGGIYATSEKWRQEIFINIARIRWRLWRDDWGKVYDSGSLAHSHFTANSSDTVQFKIVAHNVNVSYLSVNKNT